MTSLAPYKESSRAICKYMYVIGQFDFSFRIVIFKNKGFENKDWEAI